MSKIKAFRCDFCNTIVQEEEAVGILPIKDAFDSREDYPTTKYPEDAEVHHCLECSRANVILKTEELSPRFKGEKEYHLRFKELYSIFKGKCVDAWSRRSKKNAKTFGK